MAEALNILAKKKKVNLPSGWTESFSKKHPDRPYYFNENTGEKRWSPPLECAEKVIDKGKKRKHADADEEEFADATNDVATKLLNAITANRPKLKAKSSTAPTEPENEQKNDTPAMRLYREKLAQRKAVQAAKKSTFKKAIQQNQSEAPGPSKATPKLSFTIKSSVQKRLRGRSTDSLSSNCSTISSSSSLGAKIKKAAESSKKDDKLTQIPKIQLTRSKVVSKEELQDAKSPLGVNNNNSPDVEKVTTRKSLNKNLADERLQNLRKSLALEKKESPAKRQRQSLPRDSSPTDKSKLTAAPSIAKKGWRRLDSIDNRLQKYHVLEMSKSFQSEDEDNLRDKILIKKYEIADSCEEMDWEAIPDEKITYEVYSVRHQLGPSEKFSQHSYDALKPIDTTGEKDELYAVVDTNVLLSNLPFVEEIRDSSSERFGRPFIVVPWTVLQELDFIKDDRSHTRSATLKMKARKAVEFLNKHFSTKHPRFLGQTPAEVEKNKERFTIDCPDDEILQTCLQIKEASKTPVLVSYDKNLCSKGMIHDILVIGRNDPLEKMYFLKAAEEREFLSNSLHARIDEDTDITIGQKELVEADDMMEEGKAVMKSVLSQVVAKEMEALFGNRWEKHVIIKPPWTVVTVLKCALKHWIAAVGESFLRKTEPMLQEILVCINNPPEGGRKLKDVEFFLDKCYDIVQTLDFEKHEGLRTQASRKLEELKQRCTKTGKELHEERLNDTVGSVDNEEESSSRAEIGFKVFEDIYSFARDVCGIASESLRLQCSFDYNKMHPFLTSQRCLQLSRDVGTSLTRLAPALKQAIDRIKETSTCEEKYVHALYEAIVNFISEFNFDNLIKLSPLDVYYCLKLELNRLDHGYNQLQDLQVHYNRIGQYMLDSTI